MKGFTENETTTQDVAKRNAGHRVLKSFKQEVSAICQQLALRRCKVNHCICGECEVPYVRQTNW